MTPEQKQFAADNHNLVHAFLKYRHLPESEYYDIVIFGYLKAARDYLTRSRLQNYKFSTIAWRYMLRSLFNHYKSQCRQKRTATIVSIHSPPYNDGLPLEETIPAPDELMEQVEIRLLLHKLAKRVSRQQMELVRLRCSGYSNKDIARKQNISMRKVGELLEDVRLVLREMCNR